VSDLRSRLRNLRAATSRPRPAPRFESTPSVPPSFGSPQPLEVLVPGDLYETPLGRSYVVRTLHPPDHVHGGSELNGWLSQSLAGAASFIQDRRLATVDPRRCLFLDTETTGLNGGAGTLVFLVGVGRFTGEGFEVRQYFMRDPGEEPAMLHAVQAMLDEYDALVTFNGRSFDVPLLAMRYTLNRQRLDFERWPNLDLLHPARRLWRRRLSSCRLAALESSVLGVQRSDDDVPGWLIPQLYYEYLQTGDARQMRRVMYHNLVDVLSMVTLATYLCGVFTQANPALPFDDLVSLARWYEGLHMLDRAESAYQAALRAARHDFDRKLIVESLAQFLKHQDRRAEAEPYWETFAALSPASPDPRLELAKYHEWTTGDVGLAIVWTQAALEAVNSWPPSAARQEQLDDIRHRLDRLLRKVAP
jgi:uncharacterized protein YprB with RNaseH-like and TPR domain